MKANGMELSTLVIGIISLLIISSTYPLSIKYNRKAIIETPNGLKSFIIFIRFVTLICSESSAICESKNRAQSLPHVE